MSEEFKLEPAIRRSVNPLIGLFGKSGSGKTLTSLLVMLGIVGRKTEKPIGLIDTENKRASHFADDPIMPVKYNVLDLQPPFSPDRLGDAFDYVAARSCGVIIDSASHEWNGEGGCLQMLEEILDKKAGEDWKQRDKFKMYAWARVSPQHEALVAKLMRATVPVILCFRAKDKVVLEKKDEQEGERGKTKITTDEDAPIQRKDLIHEMTIAFGLHEDGENGGGFFTIRKPGAPTLCAAVKAVKEDRLGEAHGKAIARWCTPPNELDNLKRQVWPLLKHVHGGAKFDEVIGGKINQFLIDENIISDTETFQGLTPDRLKQVIEKLQTRPQ